jgi:Na+/alanine symporter
VAGAVVGVATAAVLSGTGQLFLWTAWWSFVAASGALLIVSAFTPAKSDDELRGLVSWVR